MSATSIQWTDHSVNPIRFGAGHYCQKVSPGCANCYASALQKRFGNAEYKGCGSPLPVTPGENDSDQRMLWFDESKLREVLKRRKPTRYFWCDMTDIFGEWVPDWWIDQCFATMALTPHHTHQVLTKRPERMLAWFSARTPDAEPDRFGPWPRHEMVSMQADKLAGDHANGFTRKWPLDNVWLGVSVENQAAADERIPLLLQTPAAVRFLSVEPLLSVVDLGKLWLPDRSGWWNALDGRLTCKAKSDMGQEFWCETEKAVAGRIDWCILGGESGPGARPCNAEWIRSLVRQCQAAGTACFVKQLGAAPRMTWGEAREFLANPPAVDCHPDTVDAFKLRDRKGGDPAEWPADLQIREFPGGPS